MLMPAREVEGCCPTTDAVVDDVDVFSGLFVPDMMAN